MEHLYRDFYRALYLLKAYFKATHCIYTPKDKVTTSGYLSGFVCVCVCVCVYIVVDSLFEQRPRFSISVQDGQ